MKYLLSLSSGIVSGALLLVAILYFNPFAATAKVSPLALTDNQIIDLSFNAAPADTLLFTNDGKSVIKPHPERVPELWEPTIEDSWVAVVRLTNARGETKGIGIKFSSESENTDILGAKVLVNSVWHVYLADRGTFFIDQTENYWSYLRDIVIPAKWSPANSWRGAWHRSITVGPGSLGTARVIGESGIFAGVLTEAVESLTARAYSSTEGPIAMRGNLTIALPAGAARSDKTAKADFDDSR
jgi:hypothetical protein